MDLRACGTGSKTPGGIPASSKAKLTILLKKEGFTVSSSTVGRILKSLKTRGLLREGNQKPTGESETPSHLKRGVFLMTVGRGAHRNSRRKLVQSLHGIFQTIPFSCRDSQKVW
jgi:hypothetical protein